MAVSPPVPGRLFSFLTAFTNVWRRWRWSHLRIRCRRCIACGRVANDQDPEFLLVHGYLRAAVFVSRLELETMLLTIVDELLDAYDSGVSRPRGARGAVDCLRNSGWIDRDIYKRILSTYNHASKIVHGSACTQCRAAKIVHDTTVLLRELGDGRPWGPRPGFDPQALTPNPRIQENGEIAAIESAVYERGAVLV